MDPCQTCGACCSYYRVSFYWGEADEDMGGCVPPELTESVTDFFSCMRGTNQLNPRCTALEGRVGEWVQCTIYAKRPTPCRDFGIHMIHGCPTAPAVELVRCNRARVAHGLPPLHVSPLPERQRQFSTLFQHHRHRISRHLHSIHAKRKPMKVILETPGIIPRYRVSSQGSSSTFSGS